MPVEPLWVTRHLRAKAADIKQCRRTEWIQIVGVVDMITSGAKAALEFG